MLTLSGPLTHTLSPPWGHSPGAGASITPNSWEAGAQTRAGLHTPGPWPVDQ